MMLDLSYAELIREIEKAEGRPLCDYSKARILEVISDREKMAYQYKERLHRVDAELSSISRSLFR